MHAFIHSFIHSFIVFFLMLHTMKTSRKKSPFMRPDIFFSGLYNVRTYLLYVTVDKVLLYGPMSFTDVLMARRNLSCTTVAEKGQPIILNLFCTVYIFQQSDL